MSKKNKPTILYVTGTDTDVGKTIVSAALLKAFNKISLSTVAMKPIASGCSTIDGKLFNQDALLLQANASVKLEYDIVNPVALEPAIAPHIAAQEAGVELSAQILADYAQPIINQKVDLALIEGAGGWFVPLNKKETLADFAKLLDVSVVLVVAIRLGCINHALLTVSAIEQQGLRLAGWVANLCDPSETISKREQENIEMLQNKIQAPLLAVTPWVNSDSEKIGEREQYKINKVSDCFTENSLISIIANKAEA